ncbi:MAG TPA: ABC transporter permease [Acidimicrobiales bacterium]|nr:ABC transporter permease [Acidimicrobiales bacterium]
MMRFIAIRLLLAIFVVWAVATIVFLIFFVGPGPGQVVHALAGRGATPTTIADITRRLKLNEPIYVQYFNYLGNLAHGNLGYDYYNEEPVSQVVARAFPVTLSLVVGAAVIWLVLGVSGGAIAASTRRPALDRLITGVSLLFYSIPSFVLGTLAIWLLYYELTRSGISFFPAPGYVPISQSAIGWFKSLILPWFTLGLGLAAAYTRLTRVSMLDTFNEPYMVTARAKGISESRLVYRHALRPAWTTVVSQFGVDFATLFGGAVVVEQVFGLPGLGYTTLHAVQQQDLPVVMGMVLAGAVIIVAVSFLVDVLYFWLDPATRAR